MKKRNKKEQGMIDSRLAAIAAGEDSTRQFKVDVRNVDSLASEMVAFANSGYYVKVFCLNPGFWLRSMEGDG